MLGVDLGDHERRYDLGQEWIDLVNRIWVKMNFRWTLSVSFPYQGNSSTP